MSGTPTTRNEAGERPLPLVVFLVIGVLVGTPLGLLCLWGANERIDELDAVSRRAAPTASAPGWFEGHLGYAGTRVTPMGQAVAAWSGELVGRWHEGKSTRTEVLCSLGELDGVTMDGLSVEVARATPLWGWSDLVATRGRAMTPGGGPRLFGEIFEDDRVPDGVRPRCTQTLHHEGETVFWREQRFGSNRIATFAGCRDGKRLFACAAAVDWNGLLLDGKFDDAVARAKATALAEMSFLLVVSIFFSIMAGLYSLRALRPRGPSS